MSLRISIDLDGVMWHHMAFFREFMRGMQERGHSVGILTSHKLIHEAADRALMRERGFPEPDFYFGRPIDYPHREEGYGKWKAEMVMLNRIDVHFEDDCAIEMRHILGKEAHRVFPMFPRGGEHEHFE